jgi:tetratricopeptide (TPR) repeat protein
MLLLGKTAKQLGEEAYRRGVAYARESNYRAALRAFRAARAYDPADVRIPAFIGMFDLKVRAEDRRIDSLYVEGRAFQKQGWYISAALQYLKILEIRPDHKEANRRLAETRGNMGPYLRRVFQSGVAFFEKEEYQKAAEIFKKILIVEDRHTPSKAYLDRINQIFLEKADQYFVRGLGYFQLENWERAKEEFQKALDYDPQNAEVRDYLSRTKEEIARKENLIERHLATARNLEKRKRIVSAYKEYQKVIRLDPANRIAQEKIAKYTPTVDRYLRARFEKGERLFLQGKYPDARKIFRDLLTLFPDHALSREYLGLIQKQIRTRTLRHYNQGLAYIAKRDWDRAIDEFEKALKYDPNNADVKRKKQEALSRLSLENIRNMGLAYYRQGRYKEAQEVLQRFISQSSNDTEIRILLRDIEDKIAEEIEQLFNEGLVAYSDEDYDRAIRLWDMALELDPNHSGSNEYRRRAKERLEALEELP